MDSEFASSFIKKWNKYFAGQPLPITYYYTDTPLESDLELSKNKYRCIIGNLEQVVQGNPFVYNAKTPGCTGGKRYSGFVDHLRNNFEYFLSYGIEGQLEGERYKKCPELVNKQLENQPFLKAKGKYLVFKRFDKLTEKETPDVIIFLTTPDVLSGLFTLANYDTADTSNVLTPFGSGCASILQYPLKEIGNEHPNCILGMFDISARPYIDKNSLTFSIPFDRFKVMVSNMDEAFFITESWKKIKERLTVN